MWNCSKECQLKNKFFVYYREQWLFMYLICRLQNQRYGVLQTIVKFDFLLSIIDRVLVGEIGMANLVILSTRLTIIDTKRIWGRKQYLWIISCIMKAEMFFILLICLAFFKNYYYCCLHVTSIDVLPLW